MEGKQKLSLSNVKLEMPTWYLSESFWWTVRRMSLEFNREEVWAGGIKMGLINICVVFQARQLDVITKRMKVNRE